MLCERFEKPFTPPDADGRWVYELTIEESVSTPGAVVSLIRYFFGFRGLGVDIEELSREHFGDTEKAEQDFAEKKRQLTANGYTESQSD